MTLEKCKWYQADDQLKQDLLKSGRIKWVNNNIMGFNSRMGIDKKNSKIQYHLDNGGLFFLINK